MTLRGSFNLDGTLKRRRKTQCQQCRQTDYCDICWEHVEDWSPFGIWHCLLCRMPMATFDCTGEEAMRPRRCEFCGWDEATETRCMVYDPKLDKMVEVQVRGPSKGAPK